MKIIYSTLILSLFIFAGCKGKVSNKDMINDEMEMNQTSEKSEVMTKLLMMIHEAKINQDSDKLEILTELLKTRNEVEINRIIGYIDSRQAFPPSDYIPVEMEIYELNEKYYPMFDSIILRSINHPCSRMKKLGFFITVNNEENEYPKRITILLVNHWELEVYGISKAIFYYKGFEFDYNGNYFEDMVEKKEVRTLYRVNPDLFLFGMRDDRYYGAWNYLIKDGNVIFEDSFMSNKWD